MRIRFNLERGQYYNQWQVIDRFSTWYLEPNTIFLLKDCTLINKRSTATKIFEGANKEVCAWIEFRDMTFLTEATCSEEVRFNPRENPFWTYKGEDVDGKFFDELVVVERKIYELRLCSN